LYQLLFKATSPPPKFPILPLKGVPAKMVAPLAVFRLVAAVVSLPVVLHTLLLSRMGQGILIIRLLRTGLSQTGLKPAAASIATVTLLLSHEKSKNEW